MPCHTEFDSEGLPISPIAHTVHTYVIAIVLLHAVCNIPVEIIYVPCT